MDSCFHGNDIERDENMAIHIDISRDKIAAFCRRNYIRELALFGSVLRSDFGPDIDVDALIEFEP